VILDLTTGYTDQDTKKNIRKLEAQLGSEKINEAGSWTHKWQILLFTSRSTQEELRET
jgi:hypothetical protein